MTDWDGVSREAPSVKGNSSGIVELCGMGESRLTLAWGSGA